MIVRIKNDRTRGMIAVTELSKVQEQRLQGYEKVMRLHREWGDGVKGRGKEGRGKA